MTELNALRLLHELAIDCHVSCQRHFLYPKKTRNDGDGEHVSQYHNLHGIERHFYEKRKS